MTTLLIIFGLLFAILLPRGTNVPTSSQPRIVKGLIIANLAIHCVTQIVQWLSLHDHSHYLLRQYLDIFALTPIKLDQGQDWRWMQLVTANFFHGSWSHVIFNLWFFYIYGANLEDLFGPRKFWIFMVCSMLTSQLAIVFLSQGSEAFKMPHLGFSGVVYATMAAYLICFPRSKIQVVLIYDITFWMLVIFVLGPLCLLSAWYVSSLSQLLLIAGFVLMFINMNPGHLSFGVPAFIFLGYRLLKDWLNLDNQMNELSISAWGHAGGFMAGVIAGYIVNGTKGFSVTYDNEPGPEKKMSKKLRDEEQRLQAAAANSGMAGARAYLGQRVFVGDGVTATEFYLKTVLPQYPELALDPREQLSLARMLDIRGFPEQALHAYDIYMKNEGQGHGPPDAYLAAAKLCKSFPAHIPEGLRYLQRLNDMEILNREKIEAQELREELAAIAAANGIDIESALLEDRAASDGRKSRDRWEKKLPVRDAGPIALRTSRMKQLEPESSDAQPPPIPDSTPASPVGLTGKKPLPLKSLSRVKPPAVDENSSVPGPTYQPAPQLAPIILPPTPHSPVIEDSPSQTLETHKPLFLAGDNAEKPTGIKLDDGVVHAEKPAKLEHVQSSRLGDRKATKQALPDKPRWAIILARNAAINGAALIEILSDKLGGSENARNAIAEGKGILMRGLEEGEARQLSDELNRREVSALAVSEDHPALSLEALDLLSLEIQGGEIIASYSGGRTRCDANDVQTLTYALVKLSPHSKSFRRCLEIIANPTRRRLTAWDHTINRAVCKIDGKPVTTEFALEELFLALASRVPDGALTHAARHALRAPEEIVKFESFQAYENYIAFCILSK